jgi:hypothetical protein
MPRIYNIFHSPAQSLGKEERRVGKEGKEVFTPVGLA